MKISFSLGGAEMATFDRNYFYNVNKSVSENILTLGLHSYINGANFWFGGKNDPHNILIGRFCSLSWELVFLCAYNHNYKAVTTSSFDMLNNGSPRKNPYFKNPRQIIIGHDVWIGYGAMVLGGVKIGNGAVIGAGSVVAKDIPPYAIAVGNPARVIKYRFDEETIRKLLAVKWWNWDIKKIEENFLLAQDVENFLKLHYSPALEDFPEDDCSSQFNDLGGWRVYQFIADFRAPNPLWSRIITGFCQSALKNALLVIWLDKDATEKDFNLLAELIERVGKEAQENIIGFKMTDGSNFSPAALLKATHFITTREMSTLEALDYLWNTDVKIISGLDDKMFLQ